jgi:hypothetical protein
LAPRQRSEPFFIAFSCFAAFLMIRLSVQIAGSAHSEFAISANMGELPGTQFYIGRNIILFGYHIHHFYIGILLICLAGWLAITESFNLKKRYIAVLYGVGLGLFLDEIGLLLTWGDYYSSLTYIIGFCVAGIFLNILLFHNFWMNFRKHLFSVKHHGTIDTILIKNKRLVGTIDAISNATARTARTSYFFTGALYLCMTAVILIFPQFIRYCVAGTFVMHGLSFFVRVLSSAEGRREFI